MLFQYVLYARLCGGSAHDWLSFYPSDCGFLYDDERGTLTFLIVIEFGG